MIKCMTKLGSFLFLCTIAMVFTAQAQVSVEGVPESFSESSEFTNKNAVVIPVMQLDAVNPSERQKENVKFGINNRYGVVSSCSVNLKEAGVKTDIAGKGTIWRYKIESQDAYSLGVFFKSYHLPEGGRLFFYNSAKTQVQGAFSEKNNNSKQQLPVAEFPGKDLIIEYFEPLSPEFSGEVIIGSISQAYIDLSSTATTRVGINCSQGTNWQTEKNAVCLITFNDTKYSYYCTGALMNNVKEDGTPYFLTANHCISTSSEASTLVAYFQYENSTCTSSDASLTKTLSGATLKSTNSYSDFSLLLLTESPPDSYSPYFSGWDNSGSLPSSGTCIHHPEGQPKCIAVDNNQVTSYDYSVQWTDDDGNVESTTDANTHWDAVFSVGNTEAGSSGSPLFDQNKRVVGQLHGGDDTESLYGKLSLSWNHSSTNSKQLAHWLDPDNTGVTTLDGIGGVPVAKFTADVQEACLDTPVSFTDESTSSPTSWTWTVTPDTYAFTGGTNSSTQNPKISFLQEGNYTVSLKVSNKYGSDELVEDNYITAESSLNVRFNDLSDENTVCGCDLNSYAIVAVGAYSYTFEVSETAKLDTKVSADTLFLTLDDSAIGGESFDTTIKVTGTHGSCSGTASILLHVIVQPNDNVANAIALSLGGNSGYSNHCASTETSEPMPSTGGCLVANNWCAGSTLTNTIWFTFISPSSGLITIDTDGFDDQIAVYEAESSSFSAFNLVGANDDRSSSDKTSEIENLSLDPSKIYYLQVNGKSGAYGDLTVNLISNSLEVYPNPSDGVFNIIISSPVDGTANLMIYNIMGQELKGQQYSVSSTSNKFTLDLSGYPKGVYLMNVQMNGYNHSKKLILR
jgi:PKD repeat protein